LLLPPLRTAKSTNKVVGRDHFAGRSCTARRGRTTASASRREPHRAGRRRSLPRRSRPASSHSCRTPSPRAGPKPGGGVQHGKRPHRATAPIAVRPDSGESSQPDWLTRRASRRAGACFPPCAVRSWLQRLVATAPVPHLSRYPLRCAVRRGLRGRSRGWMRVDGAVVPVRAGRTAPSTRKPGRATRSQAHHGPLPHHHTRRYPYTGARTSEPQRKATPAHAAQGPAQRPH